MALAIDHNYELLSSLPIEIWTEGPDGQALIELARDGRCKYIRINSTLARFEPIEINGCDCFPWPDKCPYCGRNV